MPRAVAVVRPPSTRLNRGRVAQEAARVLRERGLDGLTMHAVAESLGVTAMALYRHVASKEELLECAADELLADVEVGLAGPPEEQLVEICLRVRRAAAVYPGVVHVVTYVHAESPRVGIVRTMLRLLRETGRTVDQTRLAYSMLVCLMTGSAVIEVRVQRYGGASAYRAQQMAELDAIDPVVRRELDEILWPAELTSLEDSFRQQVEAVLSLR
jgi:TetR/AcrR family tetracycline transcriptional repressor